MAVPLVREIAALAELGVAFGATVDEAVARGKAGNPRFSRWKTG
jgi:hypothetical protein